MHPERLRDPGVVEALAALRSHLLVVVAYGRIIPGPVLSLPPHGGINLHPSLLPAYRGASPIQRAIAAGATTTGVTVMYLVDELDAGDIVLQREAAIGPDETAGELEARLAEAGAALLVEAVGLIAAGTAPRRPQDHARATYAGKIVKADGVLKWDRPAREVVDLVRAMNPWPCAHTTWRDGVLRIWRARTAEGCRRAGAAWVREGRDMPGRVLAADEAGIMVEAGDGAVLLLEVQPEGGRRMSAGDFLRGHPVRPGDHFGEPSAPAPPDQDSEMIE
jgi:methionyl-tRNA formyltransferase